MMMRLDHKRPESLSGCLHNCVFYLESGKAEFHFCSNKMFIQRACGHRPTPQIKKNKKIQGIILEWYLHRVKW